MCVRLTVQPWQWPVFAHSAAKSCVLCVLMQVGRHAGRLVPSMQEGIYLQSGIFAEMNELHYTLSCYFHCIAVQSVQD